MAWIDTIYSLFLQCDHKTHGNITLIQLQTSFRSSWKAVLVTKCHKSTKLRKINSNFGKICIQTSSTQRALVVIAAKGSQQQILGRGSLLKETTARVWMLRVIFSIPTWFILYPMTVNKGTMDRNRSNIKERIDCRVCQIYPFTLLKNQLLTCTYLILLSFVQASYNLELWYL